MQPVRHVVLEPQQCEQQLRLQILARDVQKFHEKPTEENAGKNDFDFGCVTNSHFSTQPFALTLKLRQNIEEQLLCRKVRVCTCRSREKGASPGTTRKVFPSFDTHRAGGKKRLLSYLSSLSMQTNERQSSGAKTSCCSVAHLKLGPKEAPFFHGNS